MASLCKRGNRYEVHFQGLDQKRRCVRLGVMPKAAAETVKRNVEYILSSAGANHSLPVETANWLSGLSDTVHARLAAAGLAQSRQAKESTTLGAFVDGYIAGRNDLKPSTVSNLRDSARHLTEYFGSTKPLADITPGDADEFRRHLATKIGDNTLRRICGRAKQFFRAALRKRLIGENPFGDMAGCNVQANKAREHFITRADTAKLIEACPDAQWRLIIALARYGGLRCPSELVGLQLDDVNWDTERVRIRSPKTEHHEGKGERIIPLFSELWPYLNEVWHEAADRETHFITRYRDPAQNLRTTFLKIIARAGLVAWPKLFQNLRASRATELAASHPAHVAAAWLGHSTIIAQKHYWQVTDADFESAIVVTQNAQHSHMEMGGNRAKSPEGENRETSKNPENPRETDVSPLNQAPPVGLECTFDVVT